MKMPIGLIPTNIVDEYQLLQLVRHGFDYIKIKKGMYGLPQSSPANSFQNGWPSIAMLQRHTHGLWKAPHAPFLFLLVVEDFSVQYVGKAHAEHLYNALEEHYESACDWEGTFYCGFTLDWNYPEHTLDLSMPGYITAVLHNYQHATPKHHCHAPSQWTGK